MGKTTKINGLTEVQREELQQALLDRRDLLRRNIARRRDEDTRVEPSEHIEEIDQANASQAQAVALRVMDKEAKLLRQVELALNKFETGEYGLCEGTEEPIGYARLKVVPWARHSVEYKEERERQQRLRSARAPGR